MKKIFIALSFLVSLSTFAAVRTAEQAAVLAAQFMNEMVVGPNKAPMTASSLQLVHERSKLQSTEPAFYIFNKANDDGFVIVSGDDRTVDILGYSNQGTLDVESMSPNFQFWLNLLQEAVSATNDTNVIHNAPQTTTVIDPLLVNKEGKEITWYQESPYNNMCPKDADGYRSMTGCVATAASMVMYKWRYPKKGTGTHSYQWTNSDKKKTTLSVDYGNTTYDWDNMLPAYMYQSSTTAQKTAVATLMYHAGVACDMQYSSEGSGAYTDEMAEGLINHFGYTVDKFITSYSKYYYPYGAAIESAEFGVSISQIKEYFNADLEEGLPIIMGGQDKNGDGGHEFVCDGRDEKGYFHINWGWEGSGNGYFSIDALKVSGYNFSSGIDAIIGLRPGIVDTIHVTDVSISPKSKTLRINEKVTLTAVIQPQDASIKKVSWSSSDLEVATISSEGIVRGVGQGEAIITVTTNEGGKTAICSITVIDEFMPSDVFELVGDAGTLNEGDDIIIEADYSNAHYCLRNAMNGTSKTTYAYCEQVLIENDVISLPENSDVAVFTLSIENGAWTLTNADGHKLSVTGNKKLSLDNGVTTWMLSVANNHATIGSTREAYGCILYNNNNNDPRFSVYTSNTSSSYVLPHIYARYNSRPIQAVHITDIELGQSEVQMLEEEEQFLHYTIEPQTATNQSVMWSSSDTSVVKVNPELHSAEDVKTVAIQAVAEGQATITAKTLDGGFVKQCVVTVTTKGSQTALDTTHHPQSTIYKVLDNGQVIFIRDGVKYSVLGVEL